MKMLQIRCQNVPSSSSDFIYSKTCFKGPCVNFHFMDRIKSSTILLNFFKVYDYCEALREWFADASGELPVMYYPWVTSFTRIYNKKVQEKSISI